MKKIWMLLFCFLNIYNVLYAGGGMTHMFIAQEAIAKIPDRDLRHLLENHLEEYLVGAYYPDSGYVVGGYGEDSHWDPFIIAFATYIKDHYTYPALQNPKLVAFLFGCATHRVSDPIMHFHFYHVVARKDFKGNRDKAHTYGDIGIDLLLNIDKNQWLTHPHKWWVPVKDLVAVYQRMGKAYKAKDIILGNQIIRIAGYGERIISLPAYPYLRLRMPWTAKNYYTYADSGLLTDENKIVEYQMKLWRYLNSQSKQSLPVEMPPHPHFHHKNNMMSDFATAVLINGVAKVGTKIESDGSVEFEEPTIHKPMRLQKMLSHVVTNLSHE